MWKGGGCRADSGRQSYDDDTLSRIIVIEEVI